MAKRILCRVVRSVPLTKSSDASLQINQSDNSRHKFEDAVTVNVQVRYLSNSVTYTGQGDIAKLSFDDGLAGQILDCFV